MKEQIILRLESDCERFEGMTKCEAVKTVEDWLPLDRHIQDVQGIIAQSERQTARITKLEEALAEAAKIKAQAREIEKGNRYEVKSIIILLMENLKKLIGVIIEKMLKQKFTI